MIRMLTMLVLTITTLIADVIVMPVDKESVIITDGDTIKVNLNIDNCPDVLCKGLLVRISGIDTPEIHGKTNKEKKLAEMAKLELALFIADGEYSVVDCGRDKFFRINCKIINSENISYSEYIIEKRLAVPYNGEAKTYNWYRHKLKP